MKPRLIAHEIPLTILAKELFKKIIRLPKEIRPDDKKRTGIQVFLREIGTDNLIILPIFKPSERAQFFSIEKAVRSATLKQVASQNSEDPDQFQYAGSITVTLKDGTKIQASTSGLKAPEDVAISIIVLAYAVQWSVQYVIKNIRNNGGILPDFLSDQQHYLRKIFAY